jgi:hypothetical protein
MQDFFFATFLYSAILSFVCCLRYQPKCAKAVERTTQELPTEEPQQADIDQALTDEIEQKLEPAHALIEDTLAAVDEWDHPGKYKLELSSGRAWR